MVNFRALAASLSLATVTVAAATVASQPLSFEYDRTAPLDVKESSVRRQGPVSVREITYAGASGTRNGATLVTPASSAQRAPGILFVHWYGPPAPTSNRTQFVPDAVALGAKGAVSLLIDTPWSNPDYMKLRTRDRDFAQSIAEVKELRRALDVLLAQPGVDAARVAFVGHDFGAMYGTLAAANDPRVSAFVFMAGTAAFSDWFLFSQPRLEGAARQAFVDHMAPLDPVAWLPKLRGPLLLQFAKDDEFVPPAAMERLIAAAPRPHEVLTYAGGHELNDQATKDRIAWLAKTLGLSLQAGPPDNAAPIEVARLRFHSDFWMNLHHTLYGAVWARRPEAGTLRARAGRLPSPLDAPMTTEERASWDRAIEYYDRQVASRDLLFGEGMVDLKAALTAGDLTRSAVGAEMRAVLESAAPVYRRHFWPAHDRTNSAWIAATAERMRTIAADTVPRLEKLYGVPWFSIPVRIDVVWVGNRQGAYTTDEPPHATISSGDPENTAWTAAEIVFHEVSHVLVLPLQRVLRSALGAAAKDHRELWHVVQFYLTGVTVQQVLSARGITYEPYMYSSGLVDRAWGRYRKPVEDSWRPYVDGKVTQQQAIEATIAALSR